MEPKNEKKIILCLILIFVFVPCSILKLLNNTGLVRSLVGIHFPFLPPPSLAHQPTDPSPLFMPGTSSLSSQLSSSASAPSKSSASSSPSLAHPTPQHFLCCWPGRGNSSLFLSTGLCQEKKRCYQKIRFPSLNRRETQV